MGKGIEMLDILIVEDNKEIGSLVAVFLRKENYAVTVAENGEKALDVFERYVINGFVIKDNNGNIIEIPELNGFYEIDPPIDMGYIFIETLASYENSKQTYLNNPFVSMRYESCPSLISFSVSSK